MDADREGTHGPAVNQAQANTAVPGRNRAGREGIPATANREDGSYREVLGPGAWARVRAEVRARFSVKPAAAEKICYAGVMHSVELSAAGWLFAQACRLIGTPLAPYRGRDVPMRIELHADQALGGIAWHRIYEFTPQRQFTVRSTKCRGGPGEFIEHIGCGFSMRLDLAEENGDLVFRSSAYECSVFGRTFTIPGFLTPGKTTVRHEQLSGNRFRFSLSVDHPLLGRTIYQVGEFYSDVSER